jgi:adenylate kinase family enzyme
VVGPPSISLNALLPKALANHSTSFEILNVGKEISSLEKDLKEDEKQNLKGARLLSNQAISSVIDKIEKAAKSDKSYVIEGFPKNLSQALELQRRGVQVSNILIINVHNEGLMHLCTSKVDAASP